MDALIPLWHTEGWIKYVSVPVFTGVIGWVTNWTGVLMLFYPVRFRGVRVPGLKTLSHLLPRRVLEVPLGLDLGRFGWQGIIPSRAAKIGSIAIDKGLTKLGTQSEFYERLDPNAISEHLLNSSRLVAPGITMIGRYAGCRDASRVPAYLNNLFRLGLIWFSREALPDQSAYDVLEAQDEVQKAMVEAGGGTTVRRSIELTAFGRNLVAMGGLLPETETISRASEEETESQLPPLDAR
jgi:hypothetical protein